MDLQERISKSLSENLDYIFVDFKDFPAVTKKTRKQNSKRIFTGGVRVNNSLYRTDAEMRRYIRRSLKKVTINTKEDEMWYDKQLI